MFGFSVHVLHFSFCTFFLLVHLALFMGHEQCIKANEQYFVSVNSNRKLFFFIVFNFYKISDIQKHILYYIFVSPPSTPVNL